MNLSDLVKRNDRAIRLDSGGVKPITIKLRSGPHFALEFEPQTRLVLGSAHEFRALETFPPDPGWHGELAALKASGFRICAVSPDGQSYVLWSAKQSSEGNVSLNWPIAVAKAGSFDLAFENPGHRPVRLCHGPARSSGAAIAPVCVGKGVEVGPGTAPFLSPSRDRHVQYVERMPAEEWRILYNKGKADRAIEPGLWDHYIVGDARLLECIEQGTLDFIFSKHVFEHMTNPLGVLEAWSGKLKPGGVMAGVVPDLRYSFDLRQPSSRPEDWEDEYRRNVCTFEHRHYDKWCRYTAPYNTPEDLIRRQYSIHAHYYTPETFIGLARLAQARGWISRCYLTTTPNNKDFGFILWRS